MKCSLLINPGSLLQTSLSFSKFVGCDLHPSVLDNAGFMVLPRPVMNKLLHSEINDHGYHICLANTIQ